MREKIGGTKTMTCPHTLIGKQWMLGKTKWQDSCPECDRKRIAELEKELEAERKHSADMKEYFSRFEPFKGWIEETNTFSKSLEGIPKEEPKQ